MPTSGVVVPLDPSGSCFEDGETRPVTQRDAFRRAVRVYFNDPAVGASTLLACH